MDEPFNGLDEELKKEIYPDILSYLKEFNVTTIMVSHNIKEVEELSDLCYELKDLKLRVIK